MKKSPFKLLLLLFVAGLFAAMTASVHVSGQKLPPKGADDSDSGGGSGRKAPPVTASQREAEQTVVPDETVAAFKAAYKKSGRPKLLFLVGIDRRAGVAGSAVGGGAVGGGAINGPGVGENLSLFDDTGITEALSTGIGAIINDDGRVRMVDLEALADKDKRDVKTMAQNDAEAAIDTLAQRVNADLVFYIKFTPTPPRARGVNDVAYRCICELKDLNQATKMPLTPFDWDGPLDNQNARRYSAALARLLCERYAKMVAAGAGSKDITIKIIELADDGVANKLKKLIRKIDGVDPTVDMTVASSAEGGTEATYTVQVDGGDASDVQESLVQDAKDKLNLQLVVLNQGKGSITLRAGTVAGTAAAPEWYLITDPKPNPVKDRFMAAYKKNPLRMALTINWLVSPEQMGYHKQRQLPMIVMQGDPRLNNLPMGPQTISLERMSSDLLPMFTDLGVEVVNQAKVDAIAKAQADKAKELGSVEDLATLLKSAHACDIVCLGLATAVGRTAEEIPYDFKLTNCNSGDLVGALTWPVDERILKISPHNTRLLLKPENRTRYIAGQMLLAIERAVGGGQIMTAELRNASGLAQVQRLADALKTIEQVTTDGVRFDNGVGTFAIRYSGAYEDLSPRISSVVESIKPVKVIEINPSAIRLDAKE